MLAGHRMTWFFLMAFLAVAVADCPVFGQTKRPARPGGTTKPKAEAEEPAPKDQDPRLSMEDIARMRKARVPQAEVVEKAKEHGVRFEMTTAISTQLRRMYFKTEQIEAIKKAYREEAPPPPAADAPAGDKGLRTTDAQRDQVLAEIKKITKLSGADLQPAPAQHITLWAAKDVQAAILPDIKKIEGVLGTKCKDPIRSGIDKRSAHIVLIKHRYEFEKWVEAMFEVIGNQFQDPNNPNGNADMKASAMKGNGFYSQRFVVFLLEQRQAEYLRRSVAAGVGYMYFTQLAESQASGPLGTGFANVTECLLAGTPSVMIFSSAYGAGPRDLGADPRAWLHLVQQRMAARQASFPGQLLAMDTSNMTLPHYAEAWTLTTLLAQQPGKFGDLIVKLREEKSAMKVVEEVYGWDEKKLAEEWHKYVLGQR